MNYVRRSTVTFQTKESLAHLRLRHLLKKVAQSKLVEVTVSSEKAILVSKHLRSTTKRLLCLSQKFMEKLAHRNLPFLNQKRMKKLAHGKLVGMTVLDYRVLVESKRPRPVSSKKAILVSKRLRSTAKRLTFLRQIFMEKLAHINLPFSSQKLMKKLAHGKLVGMTVLDYRVLVESKRPRPAGRKNKTLAHKPNLLSISKLRNRVVLRGNFAIKKFKQHIKWYTIPPPGGGKFEGTLTSEILIVTSPQSRRGGLPAQVPVKGLQGKLLNKRRPSSNGTNFSIPVRRELAIFRTKKDVILLLYLYLIHI